MKKQNNIVRFICLLLTVSVLMTHVVGVSYSSNNKVSKENKTSESKDQPQVQEFHNDVLVPSHVFDFGADAILVFVQNYEFLESKSSISIFTKSFFVWSYFDKLFELHIAINAP